MSEVNYFWDEQEDNVIEEYDENGDTIVAYTTEPTLYGAVLTQDRAGEVRHYHYDGLGNTTELTDESGNVTDTRRYSAFGEITHSSGLTWIPYTFKGASGYCRCIVRERLDYARARWYARTESRWLSRDALGLEAGPNEYAFIDNDPVNWNDHSGLLTVSLTKPSIHEPCGGYDITWRIQPTDEESVFDDIVIVQQICNFIDSWTTDCKLKCGCTPDKTTKCKSQCFYEYFIPSRIGKKWLPVKDHHTQRPFSQFRGCRTRGSTTKLVAVGTFLATPKVLLELATTFTQQLLPVSYGCRRDVYFSEVGPRFSRSMPTFAAQ